MAEVKPGQVWADRDWRMTGRKLTVKSVDGEYAYCSTLFGNREVRILLRRFKPTSTGYDLVADA